MSEHPNARVRVIRVELFVKFESSTRVTNPIDYNGRLEHFCMWNAGSRAFFLVFSLSLPKNLPLTRALRREGPKQARHTREEPKTGAGRTRHDARLSNEHHRVR
ncbi:hypothetical protein GDO78_021814 [Eleutherodactylus coqui]|uniref:Uncharacterized protein n=1 Tax=Eleutherodactylus coqui TaxID=57060 RepID=A0A8J6EC84_ELECQ|nr:hypothetical protein GDO78_021814 [Eleutherodactylus coqui]